MIVSVKRKSIVLLAPEISVSLLIRESLDGWIDIYLAS